MDNAGLQNALFHEAVGAIDAGDVSALERLLADHPTLARERLDLPGAWLRDKVGDALDGFFNRPYLLWFVAEDPARNGTLPRNIAEIARTIVRAIGLDAAESPQEQLNNALRLVCWSRVARDCAVQIDLIDVLLDAGASPGDRTAYQGRFGTHTDSAIYNGNFAAAEHLIKRGAPLTLSTVLCLERWTDVERLAHSATLEEKQDAFVLAALNGRAEAIRKMLSIGVEPTTVSARNQSHGTALHHAVWSGSFDAVRVLVEAGADLFRRDMIYNATPLGWAEHGEQNDGSRAKPFAEIASYLRGKGGPV